MHLKREYFLNMVKFTFASDHVLTISIKVTINKTAMIEKAVEVRCASSRFSQFSQKNTNNIVKQNNVVYQAFILR